MEKDTEEPKSEKRCFCGRCFHLVTPYDCVEIEGQMFHSLCSMCCICRKTPKSMKMFYGHVFCQDCFKTHVLEHFREGQKVNTNVSWMQWAPWTHRCQEPNKAQDTPPSDGAASSHSSLKKELCVRCRKPLEDEKDTVVIAGQNFHSSCAKCCCCQRVAKFEAKLYYGQVFCADCFHTHIQSQKKDNPSEFFRFCFDQFDKNTGFAESMSNFMSTSSKTSKDGPFVFVRPFCTNDGTATGGTWSGPSEAKKSRTPSFSMPEEDILGSWDNNTSVTPTTISVISDLNFDDFNINISNINYSEKIAKLSKFLHKNEETAKTLKKWKNYDLEACNFPEEEIPSGWIDLQDMSDKTSKRHASEEKVECPKCLWQTEHVIM